MKEYKFEIQHLSWCKRRILQSAPVTVTSVLVSGFELKDGHCCTVDVTFSDDSKWNGVSARVNHNTRFEYQPDGSCKEVHLSWGVQAQHDGVGVLVRLIEKVNQ